MKKIIFIMFLMLFTKSITVDATTYYYTNSKGVNFTQEQYQFVTEMFWDGYQEVMTFEDYEEIFNDDISNTTVVSKKYVEYNSINSRGTQHTTPYKTLKIAKACNSNCLMSVTLTWTSIPTVRSYDVIGAYLQNTSLVVQPTTTATTNTTSQTSNSIKTSSNGFGVSIKLPAGSNLIVTQYYRVATGGHIYASYQHAIQNITLTNSQKYTISTSGYGGVFLFTSPYNSYYDNMSGVDISL